MAPQPHTWIVEPYDLNLQKHLREVVASNLAAGIHRNGCPAKNPSCFNIFNILCNYAIIMSFIHSTAFAFQIPSQRSLDSLCPMRGSGKVESVDSIRAVKYIIQTVEGDWIGVAVLHKYEQIVYLRP